MHCGTLDDHDNARVALLNGNKPKMAYMAIMVYQGLSRSIKDRQGRSRNVKDYQGLSWTVLDCHRLS